MNTSTQEAKLSEPLAVPIETQVRLAEQKRKLAIARYKRTIRRGTVWFKPVTDSKVFPLRDGPTLDE